MLLKGTTNPLKGLSAHQCRKEVVPRFRAVQRQRHASRAGVVVAQAEVHTDAPPEQQAAAAHSTPSAAPIKEGWWTKDNSPNIRDVQTIQELVDELADAGDKLVIVEFYAPWCNACKALYPKICKLMGEHLDDVLFLKVSFEANKDMCKTMGVKVLPYFHFYRGAEGRVDQFSCTISKIQRFKDALELYTAAFCSLNEPPGIEEFPEIKAHRHHSGMATQSMDTDTEADKPTVLNAQFWQD